MLTCVLWEADSQWRSLDLVQEKILLVQKENDGSFNEPLGVADRIEELHRLNHSVHLLIFSKYQIVA